MRHHSLAVSLVLAALLGCDGSQPLEPSAQLLFKVTVAPSSTNAVAVSASRIDVSWRDNSPNETGFEVHRSTAGTSGAFMLLASIGTGNTSYSDGGLTPSTQYCYKVRAFQTNGRKTTYSTFSATACATTPAPPPPPVPPAAPTLRSADTNPFNILLWFFEDSDNEDGFKVERCVGVVCGDPDFAVIAVFASSGTRDHFFQDYDVVPGTTYTYRVRAFNGAGDSAPSNQASATACFVEVWEGFYVCGSPSLPAPGDLDAKPENSTAVTVGWIDHSTNEDGFRIERSLDGGASWMTARTADADATTTTDDGRASEQQVCYRVIAYNAQGESPPSNTDCTTPPAAPSDLVATTTGMMGEINVLGWTDNSGVEDGYEVQRFDCTYDLDCRFWTHAILGPNATSFSEEVLWGNTYIYRVLAIKDGGRSDPSNEGTVYGQ